MRTLNLPKGPYLRIAATNIDVVIFTNGQDAAGGIVTIHADVAFERVGPVGAQVTKIAFANASVANQSGISGSSGGDGITSASGALIILPPGASPTPPSSPGHPDVTTTTGGIAGVLTGPRRRRRRRRRQPRASGSTPPARP